MVVYNTPGLCVCVCVIKSYGFFFSFTSTNLNLQARFKSRIPIKSSIMSLPETNTVFYHLPSFHILFLFNHIMCSPGAEIISLFFVFPTATSTEKAQKFGENRPKVA